MPAELKDFVVNLKSLSQDIDDPIVQGGGDANGRTFKIIFTQEAANMFTPYTKVYLYWNHQQLKTYGVNVFTKISKDEDCFNPPVWQINWPKAMLHEGDVLCCIKLVDDISIAPSNNFLVHVLQDPNDGSSFVVGDDYSIFDKAVLEMNVATQKAQEQLEKQQEELSPAHILPFQQLIQYLLFCLNSGSYLVLEIFLLFLLFPFLFLFHPDFFEELLLILL